MLNTDLHNPVVQPKISPVMRNLKIQRLIVSFMHRSTYMYTYDVDIQIYKRPICM